MPGDARGHLGDVADVRRKDLFKPSDLVMSSEADGKAMKDVLRKTRALLDGARRSLDGASAGGGPAKRASVVALQEAVDAVGRLLPGEDASSPPSSGAWVVL